MALFKRPTVVSSPCEACSGCEGKSSAAAAGCPSGGPTGWPLAIAAWCVFVLPMGLALAGAIGFGRDPDRQVLGAVAGFLLGVLLAGGATATLRRWNRKKERL